MLSPDRPNWSWLNRSLIDACFQIGGDALHNYVCEICDRESEWLKPDARLYWRYHGYRLMDVLHECIDIGLLPNKDYSTQIAELDRDNLYRYSEHSKLRQLIYDQKLTVTVHEKPCNVNLNELLDEINGATKKAEIRYAIAELSEDDETYMLSWVINDRLFRHISDGGGGAIHDAFAAVNLSLKLAGCETRFISIAYDECEFIAIDSDRMLPVLKKYALTHHFQNSWTIG